MVEQPARPRELRGLAGARRAVGEGYGLGSGRTLDRGGADRGADSDPGALALDQGARARGNRRRMSTPGPRGLGFALHVLPAMLYVVAVFVGGSLGHSSMEQVPFATRDKLLHFLAFGGMVLFVWRAL